MPDMYTPKASIVDWLRLIRAEYLEIPGLHLTKRQFQRLWGLDTMTSDALIDALVDARFLMRTHAGAYRRADGAIQDQRTPEVSRARTMNRSGAAPT